MTVAGVIGPEVVTTASAVKVLPDMGLDEALNKDPYDLIILPGGQFGAPVLAAVSLSFDLRAGENRVLTEIIIPVGEGGSIGA